MVSATPITSDRPSSFRKQELERALRELERQRRRRRLRLFTPVAALAVVAAMIVVAAAGTGGSSGIRPSVPSGTMQRTLATIPHAGATLGQPSAPVTVTEFADLQCPYCDAYTLTAFPQLLTRYVKPGKVKMVFRTMSFLGADSVIAGRAAAAAEYQNKLWSFVDAFYYRQKRENSGYVTAAFLREVGSAVPGLDVGKMMLDRQSAATLAELGSVSSIATSDGVKGTPTFIIGRAGRRAIHVAGSAGLERAIERALAN